MDHLFRAFAKFSEKLASPPLRGEKILVFRKILPTY